LETLGIPVTLDKSGGLKTGDQGHLRAPEDTDPKSLCGPTFLAVKQHLFISYV